MTIFLGADVSSAMIGLSVSSVLFVLLLIILVVIQFKNRQTEDEPREADGHEMSTRTKME